MNPTRIGIDQIRESIDIGPFEVGNLAVLQNLLRQRMPKCRQPLERCLIGARFARNIRPPLRRQFQLLEEDLPELLGGSDVERMPSKLMNFLLDACAPCNTNRPKF